MDGVRLPGKTRSNNVKHGAKWAEKSYENQFCHAIRSESVEWQNSRRAMQSHFARLGMSESSASQNSVKASSGKPNREPGSKVGSFDWSVSDARHAFSCWRSN